MALLNVRWKSSDRQGGERRESIVIVNLRPAKANPTVTFGFLAESFCHALSNSAASISLLSSAMNRCIKPISPGPELFPIRRPRFQCTVFIDLACHSLRRTKLCYQRRQYPRGQRAVPETCRAVLCDGGTLEINNTALLISC